MGAGNYPRTEKQQIEKSERDIFKLEKKAYKEHLRLQGMQSSLDVPPSKNQENEIRKEFTDRRDIVSYNNPAETVSRIVDVPNVGKVDVSNIDSPNQRLTEKDNNDHLSRTCELLATMKVNDPESNLPDFKEFSKRVDMKSRPEAEVVKSYMDYRGNLLRKTEAEYTTGTTIEIGSDTVRTLEVFKSPKVVIAFNQVTDVTGFSGSYIFVDENYLGADGRITEARDLLLKEPGTIAGYVEGSGKNGIVIVNSSRVTPEFFNNGGLLHEGNHYRFEQDHGNTIGQLGYASHDDVPPTVNSVLEHCEEAAVNIRTFPDVSRIGGDFSKILFSKYHLSQENYHQDIISQMQGLPDKDFSAIPEFAEQVASFRAANPEVYDMCMRNIPKGRIGEKLIQLSDTFYLAGDPNNDFAELAAKSINLLGLFTPSQKRSGTTRTNLKRFKYLSLVERLEE